MFKPNHLITYKGYYYFYIRIPSDLKHLFPCTFIKKSLKTKIETEAREQVIPIEHKVSKCFRLIRSGLLAEDQVASVVSELLPYKMKGKKQVAFKLSDIIRRYITCNEKTWAPKTKLENEGSFKLILDIMGDVNLETITKQVVLDFRNTLITLPPNMYKLYSGRTIKQILAMDGITPMSTTSANKHLTRLSSLLKYAVQEGRMRANYAESMQVQDKRRSDEVRKAYSLEDIKKVVEHLPLQKDYPERYWVPVLGMFTGMRLDEICQLHVEDVHEHGGIWSININDHGDKKLKNTASRRIIPIHPTVLSLGFIGYVEALKAQSCQRLWNNLHRRDADGYGSAFGKWFQRFNREYVTTDKAKVFHSFRHTVADTLKQAGVQEVVIAEILGHANDSMTMSRYGKRYQPKVLLEALMHLDYGVEIKRFNH
ncbi:site-specific integrase [Geomonas nitrogeniifigens]|uniref:Site-specific integrase n=1 Tax=Geomonas diazotrophica TaxID=2843197 RepID=A0ABX8JLK2_9BACT|nr:site-specific integrase [Geomonas nitrogeniifigens]QWV98638.1 site-specific integrase [Geomonas nitrogeniifigens]